ncbi:MAG: ImmA/IrrE family metallo-endopeptidase [Panacagrimonas sp.]
MRTLYDRLKAQGFERQYVQDAILPDWWDDALFDNASNRLTAQMTIARYLGVRLQELVSDAAPLAPPIQNVRLKRAKNADISVVGGAVTAAIQAARATAALLKDRLPFTGLRPALEIRNQLLARPDCMWPELSNLVDYCWQHGIGVVHVTRLPKVPKAKKIEGLATFVGKRPVIVLCSGRDSPAWLAFHLAHELGHIMCGHVKPGDGPLVDVKLDGVNDEAQELEADQYAFQVLTGHPDLKLTGPGLTGPALAQAARKFGEDHRIHPSTVALIYGYCQKRIPVAQAALTAMRADHGARATLAEAFRRHVPLDDVPESIQRSLSATTQIYGLTHFDDADI